MSRFAPENFYPDSYMEYVRHPHMLFRIAIIVVLTGVVAWYEQGLAMLSLPLTGVFFGWQYLCYRSIFPKRDITTKTFTEMMEDLDDEAEAAKSSAAHSLLVNGGQVLVFDTESVPVLTSPNAYVSPIEGTNGVGSTNKPTEDAAPTSTKIECEVLNCQVCREYVDGYNCSLHVEANESPLQTAWIADRQGELDENTKAHTDALSSGEESRVATNARVYTSLDCAVVTAKDYKDFAERPRTMTLDKVADAAELGRARYKANEGQSDALARAEDIIRKIETPTDPRSPELIALNKAEIGLAAAREKLLFPKSPDGLVDGFTKHDGGVIIYNRTIDMFNADIDKLMATLNAEADRLLAEDGATERVDTWAESFGPAYNAEEDSAFLDTLNGLLDKEAREHAEVAAREAEAQKANESELRFNTHKRNCNYVSKPRGSLGCICDMNPTDAETHFLNSVLPKANVPNRNGVSYSQEALDQLRPQLLAQYRNQYRDVPLTKYLLDGGPLPTKANIISDADIARYNQYLYMTPVESYKLSESDLARYDKFLMPKMVEKLRADGMENLARILEKMEEMDIAEDNAFFDVLDYMRAKTIAEKGKSSIPAIVREDGEPPRFATMIEQICDARDTGELKYYAELLGWDGEAVEAQALAAADDTKKKFPACDEVDERPMPRKADERYTREMMEIRPVVRKKRDDSTGDLFAPVPLPKVDTAKVIEKTLGRVEADPEDDLVRRVMAQGRIAKTLQQDTRMSRNGLEPTGARIGWDGRWTRPDRLGKGVLIDTVFPVEPTPTPTPGTVLQAPEPKRQVDKVRYLLSGGLPMTLGQLARAVGCTESSVASRIRDLRLPAFGGLTIAKEHLRTSGRKREFTYRMVK